MQPPPVPVIYKNPGLAAVLSFFYTGLGQIYNGQIAKGIVFMVAYTIALILILVLIGIVIAPVVWIYGMFDAYQSAQKINIDLARRSGHNSTTGQ